MPPRKFFEMNLRRDTIWCILRHNFEIMLQWYFILFFSRDHVLTIFANLNRLAPIFANLNRRVIRHACLIAQIFIYIVIVSVLRQGILTFCALTSSRLDDFSDIVTYILQ